MVPFGDAPAIACDVIGLLRDDNRRHAIRKNAYKIGHEAVWSNVAQVYIRTFKCSRLEVVALSRKFIAAKTLDLKPRETLSSVGHAVVKRVGPFSGKSVLRPQSCRPRFPQPSRLGERLADHEQGIRRWPPRK